MSGLVLYDSRGRKYSEDQISAVHEALEGRDKVVVDRDELVALCLCASTPSGWNTSDIARRARQMLAKLNEPADR